MARPLIFAANWKMHHAPVQAIAFVRRFLELDQPVEQRTLWFFPPALSLATMVDALHGRWDAQVGAQNVYWEPKGAFTGELSAPMVRDAGGAGALVGHSERRHIFGETDAATALKVQALLALELKPMLCVGEQLEEREAGRTEEVVSRQLSAVLSALTPEQGARLVIAYEPVWAIGTGRVAKPGDAAEVHGFIRELLRRADIAVRVPILYGGSVNVQNVAGLLAEPEIDGVLVGGASLDPDAWARICGIGA